MIKFRNVSKRYDNGVVALSKIDFKIEKGEFLFVVGSSGAGKSTIIKLLLKEVEPTTGDIYVENMYLPDMHRRKVPFLRRKIGVVFQDFRLLPKKTVYENVAFAMEITGSTKRQVRSHVPMILGLVGLRKKQNMYPNQLSGGEKQRVSIARAMINNPPILIADEPTGNLDPETAWDIMNLLQQINNRGTTVIMATHDKNIVDILNKRVIELSDGKIIRDASRGGYTNEN
jgi:cell division transport system ATP-binding protein